MELGLAQHPDAVRNATSLLVHLLHRPEQVLPSGTSITQVYDEAEHELLILGEPGAGKSTLLLQLAQQLVARVAQDDVQPLPVLLPLSSWAAARPPFQNWLAEQVAELYDIPVYVVQRWIHQRQLLPLLDGLDEMEDVARPACIAAINAYHHTYPGPLVVCSRKAEYEEASSTHRLSLQSGVMVQPLTHQQVNAYLTQVGKPLEALRRALTKNPTLRELANTPLMLSVLMLTYQGASVRSLSRKEAELQRQVWTDYVQRMVGRKGNIQRYPLERTCAWLHWLAHEMREHNQVIFYLEHLQPDWLPSGQQLAYTWLAVRIPGILIGVLASFIIIMFLYGYPDQASLLQFGVLGGFLGGLFSEKGRAVMAIHQKQSHFRLPSLKVIRERTAISAMIGLVYGLSFGLYLDPDHGYSTGEWLWNGSINGVGIGLCCWILLSCLLQSSSYSQGTAGALRWWQLIRHVTRTQHGRCILLVVVVLGGESALVNGLSYLNSGPILFPLSVLGQMLRGGLSTGLIFGLVVVFLNRIFVLRTQDIQLKERLRWTLKSLAQSLIDPRHLRTTLLLVSIISIAFGLSTFLPNELDSLSVSGPGYYGNWGTEVFFVLGYGLIVGLGDGLSIGLAYWLLLGLFRGIAQEQIEDRDRRVFNQGIRLSFRNSAIMGVISGGVIGIIGNLSTDLGGVISVVLGYPWLLLDPAYRYSDVLHTNLSGYLSMILPNGGLSIGWLLAVSSGLLACALSGGLSVLRYSVVRLLLQRAHTFPWQAESFLEDAQARIFVRRMGGGYIFSHRLLLDYFSDLDKKALGER